MNKLFLEIKEWFADVADHIRLFSVGAKIDSLKWDLDWETSDDSRREILLGLDRHSKAYNKILARIKIRDARHRQTAKLITAKFRFVYCDGVWHRITYPQTK